MDKNSKNLDMPSRLKTSEAKEMRVEPEQDPLTLPSMVIQAMAKAQQNPRLHAQFDHAEALPLASQRALSSEPITSVEQARRIMALRAHLRENANDSAPDDHYLEEARRLFRIVMARSSPEDAHEKAERLYALLALAHKDSDALLPKAGVSPEQVDQGVAQALCDSHLLLAEKAFDRFQHDDHTTRVSFDHHLASAGIAGAIDPADRHMTTNQIGRALAAHIVDAPTRQAMESKYADEPLTSCADDRQALADRLGIHLPEANGPASNMRTR